VKTSTGLTLGQIYTRRDLRNMFSITDATINNGHFKPRDHESVWIFVTENKTPDRTPYADKLLGNELTTEGQLAGRTDSLIMEHEKHGLELLVFHRMDRFQHGGAGFRYEGTFRYLSSDGTRPRKFRLIRTVPNPLTTNS